MSKKKMKEAEEKKEADMVDQKVEKKESEGAADGEHADAAQDQELIKSMLKKYLGGEEHDEDTMKAAHEAYQVAKGSGMEDEDAQDHVGKGMKMAAMMKAHQEKGDMKDDGDADDEKKDDKKEADEKMESEESDDKECKEGEENESKKESAADIRKDMAKLLEKVTKLEAVNARQEQELKKIELQKYLDTKLAESKLPRTVTTKLRENAGIKSAKSTKEIDNVLEIYVSAFKEGNTEGANSGFAYAIEKQPMKEESAVGGFNFAECKE